MLSDNPLKYMFLILILFYQGCATYQTRQQVADFERPIEYTRFFELLDQAVKEAGVSNASDFKVSGFPYLRTNRFLADLITDLKNDAQRKQWVNGMQRLDL